MDIYVLDDNLQLVGIVDYYRSLIWCKRYNKPGDCEIYTDASHASLSLLRTGRYLYRPDDRDNENAMVCKIKKIQLDTSAEDGNYLIVTGYDCKQMLNQRIVWGMANCDGNIETFARKLVNDACINPSISERAFKLENGNAMFALGAEAGFTETLSEQVSYKNIEEKIQEYCDKYKWGYRVVLDDGVLKFELFTGTDKTGIVIFSDDFENLCSTSYTDDKTDIANLALVAGSGEDNERLTGVYGDASGVDRYELFVDARDIAQKISWAELTAAYPTQEQGGNGFIASSGGNFVYKMSTIDIQIVDEAQKEWLEANYSGTIITVGTQEYYRIGNVIIADLPSETPTDNDTCTWRDVVYNVFLLNRGAEKIAEHGEVETFNGQVIPDVTYIYGVDYKLGDIVTVRNQFGITANARITEVIEVHDENGYSIEPKFEYQGVN